MGALKYRFIGDFTDLEFINAAPLENDNKGRIQLLFAAEIRTGQGEKAKLVRRELSKELEIFWKAKVSPETLRKLKSLGLKSGAKCSIKAAIDNWGEQNSGGVWFEILELLECEPGLGGEASAA
ncbi:MAG: hypothetical protein ICV52_15565 [Microcoleus sp. C1-bin4]|jgi:hypothetical protein|nr:hypothetical protein [Microcoleus sp. C1-bin4]